MSGMNVSRAKATPTKAPAATAADVAVTVVARPAHAVVPPEHAIIVCQSAGFHADDSSS